MTVNNTIRIVLLIDRRTVARQVKARQAQDDYKTIMTFIRQDKTRQNNIRQVKTGQDKTRQDKTRQDKTRQDETRQNKARQDKTGQGKARQDKTRQDNNDNNDKIDIYCYPFCIGC